MNAILWLATLLTFYSVIDSDKRSSMHLLTKMTATTWCFRSVCEEDLYKVFSFSRFILKQLDYSLFISMRDSWLG